MNNWYYTLIVLGMTALLSFFITPIIQKLSKKIGAIDKPNKRRVNKIAIPSMGGLGIYISMFASVFFLQSIDKEYSIPIFIGSTIIVIIGILDDIFELSAYQKVSGQLAAALIPYIFRIRIEQINIPLFGNLTVVPLVGLIMTIIWVLGITNAMNLLDGLDGLASGVAIIALSTMGIITLFADNTAISPMMILIFTLIFSILGFLPYNFYPASIFLGDTGSMLLGYLAAVFSLYSIKQATFISLILPLIILGVPITDTFFAIVRRILNKKPIMSADKNHIHHRLLYLGLSHRDAVLTIYGLSLVFALVALIYPLSTSLGMITLITVLLLGLEFFIEFIGLFGENRQPLINLIKKLLSNLRPPKS